MLYPLLLDPIYHDYVWGGRSIVSRYDRAAPAMKRYAESWEVCGRDGVASVVRNGPLAGKSLLDISVEEPFQLYGTTPSTSHFPLKVTLVDTIDPTNIHVHPSKDYARLHGKKEKRECWYILDAAKGSRIYGGFAHSLSRVALEPLIGNDTIVDTLHKIEVTQGDLITIPSGLPHGIGGGILLLKIQENVDDEETLFSWHHDNTLTSHAGQALDYLSYDPQLHVTHQKAALDSEKQPHSLLLAKTPFATIRKVVADEPLRLTKMQDGFEILFIEEGSGVLQFERHTLPISPGMTILLPHICKKCTLETKHVRFLVIGPT